MSAEDRTIHQPIHPDVRPRLDPEYVAFHDRYLQYAFPDDRKGWDGSARTTSSAWPPTEGPAVPVGAVRDLDLGDFGVRVFTPEGAPPAAGWPALLWFHGGGWAVGSAAMSPDLCSSICRRARCVVVSVGYRLAPENPFPAAQDDASAGGQMSAVLAMQAAQMQPPIRLAFQLLIVPVIDNTATAADEVWAARPHAPWLTPARMLWYRRMYLPDDEDGADADARPTTTTSWQASPNLAPASLLASSPRTWIAVSEQDLLAAEGERYAAQLRDAWGQMGKKKNDGDAEVVLKSYVGMTHSILALSGILTKGKQLVDDAVDQAVEWFKEER
ncbi:Alpha/Beta hydrolase protein [Xylariaceae sp. FL0804]|nr:Alpha/Beta hydrolase protein [Xylariaceae sp. FL0804]